MKKIETRENDLEAPRDRLEALLRLILYCLVIGFTAVIVLLLIVLK